MSYLIAFDGTSAVIFTGVILAVAISRKIDNPAFYLGVFLVLAGTASYRYFSNNLTLDLAPVALIALAGFVDEVGNDMADMNRIKGWLKLFFDERFFLKLMILLFVFFGVFHWVYLIAFLIFDLAYALVSLHSTGRLIVPFLALQKK